MSYLTGKPSLPSRTLVLDRHGLAHKLCLPMNGNSFQSSLISFCRTRVVERLDLGKRLEYPEGQLRTVSAPDYHRELSGTLGADHLGGIFP